jgi:tRNA threonylcarbamoyladenosine biosynthesis protein TsaB
MSLILGIDTSSTELGLALLTDDTVICAFSRYVRNSHSEQITSAVSFMLTANAIKAQDITHVGLAVGPGSFTGLRIGIAFVKGLFLHHDVAALPVSSLESAAAAWHGRNQTITVAFDARNNQVFWAQFRRDGESLRRLTEDELSPLEVFSGAAAGGDVIIVDSLGYRNSAVAAALNGVPAQVYELDRYPVQRGLACGRIAREKCAQTDAWHQMVDIAPRYLQLSAAEVKKNAAQCGTELGVA